MLADVSDACQNPPMRIGARGARRLRTQPGDQGLDARPSNCANIQSFRVRAWGMLTGMRLAVPTVALLLLACEPPGLPDFGDAGELGDDGDLGDEDLPGESETLGDDGGGDGDPASPCAFPMEPCPNGDCGVDGRRAFADMDCGDDGCEGLWSGTDSWSAMFQLSLLMESPPVDPASVWPCDADPDADRCADIDANGLIECYRIDGVFAHRVQPACAVVDNVAVDVGNGMCSLASGCEVTKGIGCPCDGGECAEGLICNGSGCTPCPAGSPGCPCGMDDYCEAGSCTSGIDNDVGKWSVCDTPSPCTDGVCAGDYVCIGSENVCAWLN
jgi:hypothetical protein